jgi:hypothetical protein
MHIFLIERSVIMSKLSGKNKNSKDAEKKRMEQQLAALARKNAAKKKKK